MVNHWNITEKLPFPANQTDGPKLAAKSGYIKGMHTTAPQKLDYAQMDNRRLYDFLEQRYGPGFAQKILDGMPKPPLPKEAA